MFKKLLFLILINQAALIFSMKEDENRGIKRPREDEKYLKNDREIKRSRLEIQEDNSQQELLTEETNLLQGLPAELQLLIYSFVVQKNKSIGESLKNLFTCLQLNKQSLNFLKNEQNWNYLLKRIFDQLDEKSILDILLNREYKKIKEILNDLIYRQCFLNKEFMTKLLDGLVQRDFMKAVQILDVFFKSYLEKCILSSTNVEDSKKVLDWFSEIWQKVKSQYRSYDLSALTIPGEKRYRSSLSEAITEIFAGYQNISFSYYIIQWIQNPRISITNELAHEIFVFYARRSLTVLNFLDSIGINFRTHATYDVLNLILKDEYGIEMFKFLFEHSLLTDDEKYALYFSVLNTMPDDQRRREIIDYLVKKENILLDLHQKLQKYLLPKQFANNFFKKY